MAIPLTASKALRALRAEGLTVKQVGNWRTHNRNRQGRWGPVHGVILHHTGTRGTERTVELCRDGRPGLPGPLCHAVIDKRGVVWLVGWGRTNHAGLGDPDVLGAVVCEQPLPADDEATVDGNPCFYGFECVNLGDGYDPWPAAQVDAMVRASAALLKAHGWGLDGDTSLIGHKEWQPGKPDPRGLDMRELRRRVAAMIRGAAAPPAPPSHGGGGGGGGGAPPPPPPSRPTLTDVDWWADIPTKSDKPSPGDYTWW
ncbi:peptidoglycan recognition family protein [Streptomyces sp. NPDC000151]|uniref:peptidoglycan recognition protein family protein n=1 Tax=Streptomyces sp. NPDC000151 TaxID=3154244 RepID=UPI00332439FE